MSVPRKNRKTRRGRPAVSSGMPPAAKPDAPDPEWEQFVIRFKGFIAEADLRGMSPLAVFFEWMEELQMADPERAAALFESLPRATRSEYRGASGSRVGS